MWWAETQTAGAGQMVSHPALTGTGPDPSAPMCRPRPAGSGWLGAPFRARDPDANRQLARNWAAAAREPRGNVSAAVLPFCHPCGGSGPCRSGEPSGAEWKR